MKEKLQKFVFRTRGIWMLVAISVAVGIKIANGGKTPLSVFIAGLIIIATAQMFRVYAASHLWGRQAVTRPEADFLCTCGPYAYLRHPFYLGNFFIGIGLCIVINEWYAYILFIFSYVFVYSIVIPYEEKYLVKKFGKRYLEYKFKTGRFVPKLKGYKSDAKVVPNYKAGIMGEIHVPIILVLILWIIYKLFV